MLGQDSLPSVLGPICNSLSGIKIFVKAVVDQKPWLKDPLAAKKKWDDDEYSLADREGGKQLCFGILWDDGVIVPHPPITRALEMTKKALLAAGHKGMCYCISHAIALNDQATVVDWKPYKHPEMYQCVVGVKFNS